MSILRSVMLTTEGTLRWNLDPEQEHSDFELWSALTDVCMKKKIEQLPGQLDLKVSESIPEIRECC